jgi:arylsulfatase
VPLLFDLREDPFERAQHEAGDYERWFVDRVFLLAPAQAIVGRYLQSLRDFPPRQAPGTFSVGQALQRLRAGSTSDN